MAYFHWEVISRNTSGDIRLKIAEKREQYVAWETAGEPPYRLRRLTGSIERLERGLAIREMKEST